MAARRKREEVGDEEAVWEFQTHTGKHKTTWGPWTDVLQWPAKTAKQEKKGVLAKSFANLTSLGPYKSRMYGPPNNAISAGVYEWRVTIECNDADVTRFEDSCVLYCGKAKGGGLGVHQRVRNESLGKQGGALDLFMLEVLMAIEDDITDAEYSVAFQSRASAESTDPQAVIDDASAGVAQGLFPAVAANILHGGVDAKSAEENLLGRFDYMVNDRGNGSVRLLPDFSVWLKSVFKKLPPRQSPCTPVLEELMQGSKAKVVGIVKLMSDLSIKDSDELALVLKTVANQLVLFKEEMLPDLASPAGGGGAAAVQPAAAVPPG